VDVDQIKLEWMRKRSPREDALAALALEPEPQ